RNNGSLEARAEAAYQAKVDESLYVRPPAELQVNVAYAVDGGVFYASRMRSEPADPARARLSGVLVGEPDGAVLAALDGEWDSEERAWRLLAAERTPPGGVPAGVRAVSVPSAPAATPAQTLAPPGARPPAATRASCATTCTGVSPTRSARRSSRRSPPPLPCASGAARPASRGRSC